MRQSFIQTFLRPPPSINILEEENKSGQIEGIAEREEQSEELVKESAEGSAQEVSPEESVKERTEIHLEEAQDAPQKDEP